MDDLLSIIPRGRYSKYHNHISIHVVLPIKFELELTLYDKCHKSTPNLGDFYFYSLSMNSLTPGGSGASPFLFLMSAIAVACIDFGTSDHSLKEVFQVARPAV